MKHFEEMIINMNNMDVTTKRNLLIFSFIFNEKRIDDRVRKKEKREKLDGIV